MTDTCGTGGGFKDRSTFKLIRDQDGECQMNTNRRLWSKVWSPEGAVAGGDHSVDMVITSECSNSFKNLPLQLHSSQRLRTLTQMQAKLKQKMSVNQFCLFIDCTKSPSITHSTISLRVVLFHLLTPVTSSSLNEGSLCCLHSAGWC